MSARIPRLWQPGNPQVRVFLPDFWIRPIETSTAGWRQLPKNVARFECDLRMSKFDIRQYLEKIYKLPVRDVRTRIAMGDITWDLPLDRRHRRALWKEEDRKIAYVVFKKGFVAEFPDIFTDVEDAGTDLEKTKENMEKDANRHNEKFVNRDRHGVGRVFGI